MQHEANKWITLQNPLVGVCVWVDRSASPTVIGNSTLEAEKRVTA